MLKSRVLLCTDRVGYGHIRGMLAVEDALGRLGIQTEAVFASQFSSSRYRRAWWLLSQSLDVMYKLLPDFYSRMQSDTSLYGFRIINSWMRFLDAGTFARFVDSHRPTVVVASHITASHLIQRLDVQVYLLGLDPYAAIYLNCADNVITTAVDAKTQYDLLTLGAKRTLVTGPMVPLAVLDVRSHFSQRLLELRAGRPLRIVIATGGSLTHGKEIADLTGAFARLTTPYEIERISVVVGDSRSMEAQAAKYGDDSRVNIIFNPQPDRLVRMADQAIADSDVIFAKTGELVFCIAGGKAFKSFCSHPSLGPQEVAIKNYALALRGRCGVAALEQALPATEEVHRLLAQRANGTLFDMMMAGLYVPGDGPLKVARMIQRRLNIEDNLLRPVSQGPSRDPAFTDGVYDLDRPGV